MKKLLHIIVTPKGKFSRTLSVTQVFLEEFNRTHKDWQVDELNLFTEQLPELTVKTINGKYQLLSGKELDATTKPAWQQIIKHITRFKSADGYLLSVPMWNFSVPYVLKHYIDIIVQPKYLFQYTEHGVEGLAKNKPMLVVTSRGGDYSMPAMQKFDLQEPYLRAIFGLIGIDDIDFVNAEPMDAMGEKVQQQKIQQAQTLINAKVSLFK